MKRLLGCLGIFIFVAFCAANAHAQQKYIGVILGANFANESLDSLPSGIAASHRTGMLAGVQSERWFSPQWGLCVQGIYSQEGHNENLDGAGTGILYGWTRTGSENVKSSSLTADVLLKRSLWADNPIRTYAFAGAAMGAMLTNTDYYNVTVSKPGNPSTATDTKAPMHWGRPIHSIFLSLSVWEFHSNWIPAPCFFSMPAIGTV